MLFGAHPAFVVHLALTIVVLGMSLDQSFIELAEYMLLRLGLTFFCTLVLFNVALRCFIKAFEQLFVSSIFISLFVA